MERLSRRWPLKNWRPKVADIKLLRQLWYDDGDGSVGSGSWLPMVMMMSTKRHKNKNQFTENCSLFCLVGWFYWQAIISHFIIEFRERRINLVMSYWLKPKFRIIIHIFGKIRKSTITFPIKKNRMRVTLSRPVEFAPIHQHTSAFLHDYIYICVGWYKENKGTAKKKRENIDVDLL